MRKTTKDHGLSGAVLVALIVAAVMLLLAGGLLVGYFGGGGTDAFATGFVVIYALILLAIAVGVIAALVQRWREVRGGEEDEAKKY